MLKKLFAPTDMTKGSVWKGIVLFTLPMLVGNIAQQLYSTVDSIVVGNFVSKQALAAVGTTTPIVNMLIGFFNYKTTVYSLIISIIKSNKSL